MTNLRTGLEELPESECWELMATKTVGRLAVSVSNQPDIFPVNYKVVDRAVMVQTLPGLKLASATLGRGVAFEVDDLHEDTQSGWSVVVRGTAEEIEDLEELLDADDLQIGPWADSPKHRFLRITPATVTGRRIPN